MSKTTELLDELRKQIKVSGVLDDYFECENRLRSAIEEQEKKIAELEREVKRRYQFMFVTG